VKDQTASAFQLCWRSLHRAAIAGRRLTTCHFARRSDRTAAAPAPAVSACRAAIGQPNIASNDGS